jgi:hypothetical protein
MQTILVLPQNREEVENREVESEEEGNSDLVIHRVMLHTVDTSLDCIGQWVKYCDVTAARKF